MLNNVHTGGENSPPLFFLLAWATAKVGDPSVWIRLPSVLAGTVSVPLAYALGRETVGRIAGLIAALIMAVAPFTIFYGVEARPYALMIGFVLLRLPHLRGKSLAVIGALYPLGVHRVLTDLLRPIGGHPAAPLRAIPTLPGE